MRLLRPSARRSAVVALMSILTLLATALPALAHHPEVRASAACAEDGQIRVVYEAQTWATSGLRGLHDDIRVGYSWTNPGSGASANAPFATQVGTGAFTDSADAASDRRFSGSFLLPVSEAGRTVFITTWAVGSWQNDLAGNEFTSTSVQLPADCPTDVTAVDPSVTPSQECEVADQLVVPTTPGVVYSLTQDGADVSGTTITGPDSGTLYARAAGDDYTLTNPGWTFPFDLAGPGGSEPCDETVSPVSPNVTRAQECGVADSLVVATTPGVIYSLSPDGADVSGTTITGPDSGTLYARAADGFSLGDDAGWTQDFELAGSEPCSTTTTVAVDCEADDVVVTVDTDADAPVYATIDGETIEVVDGEAVFEGLGDGTYTVVITDSEGVEIDREVFTVDCDEPVVEVATSCVDDAGTVVVTVDEAPEGSVTATIGDTVVEVVDGEAVFTLVQDGTYTVVVSDASGAVVQEEQVVVDCDEPVAVVTSECIDEDGTVTVVITETPQELFTVTVGGQSQQTTGGTVTFEDIADGAVTVTVTSDQGYEQVVDLVIACDDDTDVGGEVEEKPRPNPAPEPEPQPEPAPTTQVEDDQLAATGVATNLLVLGALLVMALGGALLGGTRRQGWHG